MLSQFQKHLCTIMSPGLKPCTLWHSLQTQMLLLHLQIVMDHREVGVTRAACKLADTHECLRHTQHDPTALRRRLRPLASSTGRHNRLAQWGGKEREHAPEFPATLLDRPVAARSRAKSTCGAQETIYKQEMQIQVTQYKRRQRRDKMTK